MDADCPLCRQVRGNDFAADELVWPWFPHSIAVLGPWQHYHGYCVLISRTHATELGDLPPAERAGFLQEMCVLAEAIARAFQPRKMNYELLGNQVPHLHWHLFPRFDADPDKLKPVWVALERAERDEEVRARLIECPVHASQPSQRYSRAQTIQKLQGQLLKLVGPPL